MMHVCFYPLLNTPP